MRVGERTGALSSLVGGGGGEERPFPQPPRRVTGNLHQRERKREKVREKGGGGREREK